MFAFGAGFADAITDFAAGVAGGDVIDHDGLFAELAAVLAASHQVGNTVHIDVNASTSIILKNVTLANVNQSDFLFV